MTKTYIVPGRLSSTCKVPGTKAGTGILAVRHAAAQQLTNEKNDALINHPTKGFGQEIPGTCGEI